MHAPGPSTCGAPTPSFTVATEPPALLPSSMSSSHAAAAAVPGKRTASPTSAAQRNGDAAAAFPASSRCSSSLGDPADTPPLRQSTQPRTASPSPHPVVGEASATPSPGQTPESAVAETAAAGMPPLAATTTLPPPVCGASAVAWGSSGTADAAERADGAAASLGSAKSGRRQHKAGSGPHAHRRSTTSSAAAAESRSAAERCKAARTLAAELMSALMERPPEATKIAQYRAAMRAATESPPTNGAGAASKSTTPHAHRRHAHHADASAATSAATTSSTTAPATRPPSTATASHSFLEAVLHGRSKTPVGSSPSTPLMHLRTPSAPLAAPALTASTPTAAGGAAASAAVVPPAADVLPGRRSLELVPGDTAIIPQLLSVLREIALSCASLDMLGRVSASTSPSAATTAAAASAAAAATPAHVHPHAGKAVGGTSAPVTAAVVGHGVAAPNGGRAGIAATPTSELDAEEEGHWNRVRAHFEVVRGLILNEQELASVLDDALGAEWRATDGEEEEGAAVTAATEVTDTSGSGGGINSSGAALSTVVVPVMPTPVDGETPPTSSRLASRGADPVSPYASPAVSPAPDTSPRGNAAVMTTTTSSHTATNVTGTVPLASSLSAAATTTTTSTTLNHNARPFHSRTPPGVQQQQQQQQQRRGLGSATSCAPSPAAPSPVAHRRASSNAVAHAPTNAAILGSTSAGAARGSATGAASAMSMSDASGVYSPSMLVLAGQDRGTTAPATSSLSATATTTNTPPPPRTHDDGGGDAAGTLNFPSTPLSEAAVPYQPSPSLLGTSPRSSGVGGGMSTSSTTPFHLESREEMLRRRSAAPNAFYASMTHGGTTHFLGGPPGAAATPGTFGPSSLNAAVPPFSLSGGSGARSLPVSPIMSYSSPLGASPCPYEYLLVLDFEATCEEHPPPNYLYEIIEFPVVVVDVRLQRVVAEFHRFVRPRYKRELSAFCKELTGMRQEDVDAAAPLEEVLLQFERWYANTLPLHARCVFATDGPMDLREFMYHHSVSRQGIRFPPLFYQFIDVKQTFACFFQCAQGKIKAMLEVLHLPFEGRLHSGLDDARNIASIVIGLLHYGCSFCEVPLNRLPLNGLLLGSSNGAGTSLPLSLPPSTAAHGLVRARMAGATASSPTFIAAPYSVDEDDCSF